MNPRQSPSRFFLVLTTLVALTGLAACNSAQEGEQSESSARTDTPLLSVYVVNYPLQYFAEQIGGLEVRVTFPAPAEGDPAFWNPTPEQIVAYQNADLILINGASYAKWVSRVSLPASRMVDTSAAITDKLILLPDQTTHSHGPQGEHEHGDLAFTTWLDPQLAIAQARTVKDALIRVRPEASARFEEGFATLSAQLESLDQELSALVRADPSRPLIFSHPVYQYFIHHYGLNGRELHWEPDVAPTATQWAELKSLLAEHPAQWMVWEGAPLGATVEELEAIGVQSLTFDPCGNVPETGNYHSVMMENLTQFQRAF